MLGFWRDTIQVMNNSTPEMEDSNWFRFSEIDTRAEWEIDDPDEVEEDSYDEESSPHEK